MESSVIVVSNVDGRKYKMVMRGDIGTVQINKIKRYMHQATGLSPAEQQLTFNNREVFDDSTGAQVGLFDGAVLFLDVVPSVTHQTPPPPPKSDPMERLLAEREEEARLLRRQLDFARERERNSESANGRLERILAEQQQQIDDLRRAVTTRSSDESRGGGGILDSSASNNSSSTTSDQRLRRTLIQFASELRLGDVPTLDANHTCVVPFRVGVEDVSMLLTFDPVTDRLYLYATLLSELPSDPMQRLRLYEALLEGALLGREMAGGGVGVSVKNELVLLALSVDLRHSDEKCLSAASGPFVESFLKWSEVCRRFATASTAA